MSSLSSPDGLEIDRDAEFKVGNRSDLVVAQLAVPESESHYGQFRFYGGICVLRKSARYC